MPTFTYSFSPNTRIKSSEVNQNFNDVWPTNWTAWTPTWTNVTTTNLTVDARYTQIGDLIGWILRATFGAASEIGAGGLTQFTVPVNFGSFYTGNNPVGDMIFIDQSTGNNYNGKAFYASATTITMIVETTGSTYSGVAAVDQLVPFDWTNGDAILGQGWYKVD